MLGPRQVCVFPEEVCPYANNVPLIPWKMASGITECGTDEAPANFLIYFLLSGVLIEDAIKSEAKTIA